MRDIPNTPLEQCGFSARVLNTLRFNGYKTAHDIFNVPVEELIAQLLNQYNFGKRSESELREWLYTNHPEKCFGLKGLLEELADLYETEAKIKKLIAKKEQQVGAIKRMTEGNSMQAQAT